MRLRVPVIAGLTLRNATISGPHAARAPAVFGIDPRRAGTSILAAVEGLELGARSIRITSDITAVDRPDHTFLIVLGRSFSATRLRFEIVRTGTGDIEIAAGRDVQLRNQFATIYTAGVRIPDPTQIFAAGDHLNDLPMLDGQHAGCVAAPDNAVPEVKALVRRQNGYISHQPWGHGVARALEYFLGDGAEKGR